MEEQLQEAIHQRDELKLAYQAAKFKVNILETLNTYHPQSVVDKTFPYEGITVMGIPASQGIVKACNPIQVYIQPDPMVIIQKLGMTLMPNPVNVSLNLSGDVNHKGLLINWSIDSESLGSEISNLIIPDILLQRLADQIGPKLTQDDLDEEANGGQFDFNWLVYLVIPPQLSPKPSTKFTPNLSSVSTITTIPFQDIVQKLQTNQIERFYINPALQIFTVRPNMNITFVDKTGNNYNVIARYDQTTNQIYPPI